MSQQLTRAEIEQRLERGLVGKMVSFLTIHSKQVVGKVQRLSVNIDGGEVMVTFMLGGQEMKRYEVDIRYFNENTEILYGDTYTGDKRNIRRILQGY